ncbi:glycoside hydrolase family 115 protein [Dothidotthia symphoricarpi CBS 119687]|uniref:Glycoside hydrolase family 115 protein n=1 Tax=Dothidotthia symphoricarpi CBS 119687 TaxID=1392245 RepID=A0A6A6A9F7_9PLEO|nr:glycoside hydrolase family 115 protein [Dothidotthia symphoricarpi CBS 119687]KAF2127478.1 glycoside hydrolase family 115 protein [Dothidotthia symphoricarpi CBS 119687]
MELYSFALLHVFFLSTCYINFASAVESFRKATVSFEVVNGSFSLATKSSPVQIQIDAADWPGVLRAANDLAVDFGRVTGVTGTLIATGKGTANASAIFNVTGINEDWSVSHNEDRKTTSASQGTIIVGTIGNSSFIDGLIENGKLDISKIEGQWEAYTSTTVKNPVNGIEEALIIAGSDRRGTIYGIYDLSEQIGVSPWHWFADVPAKSHASIHALQTTKVQKSPTVRYRGFFINDEAPALTGWANKRYPLSAYGCPFGAEFYSHVFELLLRSKANYLWPAMWNGMFNVDDPRNQPLADEYGIVMGTSHTEPMVRATQEWSKVAKGAQSGWQWATNNATLYDYFYEGAQRAAPYENMVTIGMRGYDDTSMSADVQTDVLEAVVTAQQDILNKIHGDASKVPQMWCLYKEVQDYFEAGMQVPEYVTLLWTEDNFQNIRRLPVGDEKNRSGGAGVYYHFDYVGDSRNYKWLDTIQLQKTYEQMRLAKDRAADRIWIVNVGDIKPNELAISHWFDIAYDIDAYNETSVPQWIAGWAARNFDDQYAQTISDVMDEYGTLASMRKFEWVEPSSYSILNYEEADHILSRWQAIGQKAQTVNEALSASQQPAFYQMVLHRVLAGGNFVDIQIAGARNIIYSGMGRNSANKWLQHVIDGMLIDHNLTKRFDELLGGKWAHMMDQTHLGYKGYWQQPMRQSTPDLRWVQTLEKSLAGDMGISVEGSNATIPGDDQYHSNGGSSLNLQAISPFTPPRWLDIAHVGTESFDWNISADPFITLSQRSGTLNPESEDTRVYVNVNWTSIPEGFGGKSTLNISSTTGYGTQGGNPQVVVQVNHTSIPSSFTAGFVESAGQIAWEAEHYTRITPSSSHANLTYAVLPKYGRTLSAVKLNDSLAESLSSSTAPALEYDFYTYTPTTSSKGLNLTLILSPSLNINPKKPLAYIAQIDDKPEQRRQYVIDQPQPNFPVNWGTAVAQNAWYNTTNFGQVEPGKHTLKIWLAEANVILQKVVLDLGGVVYSHNGPPESFRV